MATCRLAAVVTSGSWRNVWLLAAASFISDVSGEMLQAVLPFLLVGAQGATGLGVAIVGGVSEAVGHGFKLVGGYLGDRQGDKKPLVATGYGLASLARIGVAVATAWQVSLAFRSIDRVGKGLRTAPRDAILADLVPKAQRGQAFGLHRAADTAGAVVGIMLCVGAFLLAPPLDAEGEARLASTIVLAGALIGLTSVIPVLLLRTQPKPGPGVPASPPAPLEPVSPRYGGYLAVTAISTIGHVSYLFLILRAAQAYPGPFSPVVAAILWYLLFNIVYMGASYPAGLLADRFGRLRVLAMGYALAIPAFALFAFPPRPATMAAGFLLLGLSFAATETTSRALAADLAGTSGRSTRLGWFHFTTGMATLVGSLAAGLLWDSPLGPTGTFLWGAGASLAALAALLMWAPLRPIRTKAPPEPPSANGIG